MSLSAVTSGATAYQWQYNGTNIPGATNSTLSIPNIGGYQGGLYTALVTTSGGTIASSPATVAVNVSARLANLSSRAFVGTGAQSEIAGFVINGSTPKHILIRGVGPGLAPFALTGSLLPSTILTLFDSSSISIAADAGWSNPITLGTSPVQATVQLATSSLFTQLFAFPLTPGSGDSSMVATLPAGTSYTTQLTGSSGSTGIGLVELYDADSGIPVSDLSNISTRAFVGTGSQAAIVGFVISGSTAQTVLLRAIGPALSQFGISGNLANPQLILFDNAGLVIATNTGWGNASVKGSSQVAAGIAPATAQIMSQVYAFTLPANSADCAMLATLPPGIYTAEVVGLNSSTGIALVEVYNVQ